MASKPPFGSASVSTLASNATPTKPSVIPNNTLRESRVRSQIALMAVAQMGAVALRIDKIEAETVCAAYANKRNGNAELNKPNMR